MCLYFFPCNHRKFLEDYVLYFFVTFIKTKFCVLYIVSVQSVQFDKVIKEIL